MQFFFKVWAALSLIALVGCGGRLVRTTTVSDEVAVTIQGSQQGGWIGGSPVQTQVVLGDHGETYVGVWLQAPNQVVTRARAPMAVSLVIDTSGSMAGEKIANARMAASSFIETLADGDIVSLIAFSSTVTELAPPTILSRATRPHLMAAIGSIWEGGGTNMYDGLVVGEQRVAQTPLTHSIRRVVLISDGQANIGPSDPGSLARVAINGTESGAQVTAIGVGSDYDENTLAALAVSSSGRLYHLQQPAQMAMILEQELNLLASTVATGAVMEIVPAPGVQILGVDTPGAIIEQGAVRVPIGTVFAGQQREILLRAQVDTQTVGSRPLATARLRYAAPEETTTRSFDVDLAYEVTPDRSRAAASRNPRVQGMVVAYEASQAQLRAAQLLNDGNTAEATAVLDAAAGQLQQAAQAAPVEVRERLEEQRTRVMRGRARAAEAATPAAAREAALESNSDAYDAMGY